MATETKMAYDPVAVKAKYYVKDLPVDIDPIRKLFQEYSGIPAEEVDSHIHAVRDKLWAVKPYVCIGRFRFLSLQFTSDPRYQHALARLKAPGSQETFLDLACCIGQVLRQLAYDGVDSSRLYGTDLEPGFLDLGYEAFRDRKHLKSTFVPGNVLSQSQTGTDDERLAALDGKINIIQAGNFFHLFTWADQVHAAKRIIKFLNPKDPAAYMFGRQLGADEAGELVGARNDRRYLHNAESWQRLWDEVGAATRTKWRTEFDLLKGAGVKLPYVEDGQLRDEATRRFRFGVYRA